MRRNDEPEGSSPADVTIESGLVAGIERDGLSRTLFWLALPALGEQLLSFCVTFFDTWLSGRLGAAETSAIGLAGYIDWLASLIFSLVSSGTVAVIARCWGAGDRDAAQRAAHQALLLSLVLGTAIGVAFWWQARPISWLLQLPADSAEIATRFLQIDALGQLASAWMLAGSAALRGTGDMRTPLWVLGATNIVNVIAATWLVFGGGPIAAWGVDGIAYGTLIARGAGALLMTWALMSGLSSLRLRWRELRPEAEMIGRILRVGGPAAAEGLAIFVGHFLFIGVVARVGLPEETAAIFAAHTVGVRVEAISYLPVLAWGYAASSLVGQCLGAGRLDLARQVAPMAIRQCLLWALLCTVLFATAAPAIFRLMHADPDVWRVGIPALQLMATFQIPNAYLIVYLHALRGAGDTRYPLVVSLISVVGVRVGLAMVGGWIWPGGLVGAWLGMGADNALRAVLFSRRYAGDRWTATRV